jgi:hypothetical protein
MLATAYTNNTARKLAIMTNNELSNNIVSTVALLIGGTAVVVESPRVGRPMLRLAEQKPSFTADYDCVWPDGLNHILRTAL